MIDREITRDGKKPSIEISVRIEAPDFFGYVNPRLLEKILGFAPVAHQAQQEPV